MQLSDIKKIAVIGAGTMGAGIAQACAAAGFQVTMRDIEQRFVDGGLRRIREPLQKRVERGKMAQVEVDGILSKIHGVLQLKQAIDGAQLVIEAVFEKMEIKKELYAELDRLCPPSVVFASNTSSLSITEMATATKRADRVVGMHFFNPAPVMKLVEVIRGSETSDDTVRLIKDLCAKLGKEAVEVRESPGFVVNRLLVPMMNEAFNLLQEGVSRFAEEDLHHVEADVEAGVVRELERPHRHVRTELQRLVDVLRAGDAFLEEVERLVHHGDEETIHDEPRRLPHLDGLLPEFCAEVLDQPHGVVGSLGAADHLDELHDRRRVEEVHADDAVRPFRRGRHLRDAQGRRIRCEHDRGRAETVQLRVELLLDLHLLEDRFDDELRAVDRLLQLEDSMDLREDPIDLHLRHL